MSTRAAVGNSLSSDPQKAAQEALLSVLERMPDKKADLLVAFATASYDQEVLNRALVENSGDAKLIGCSGEGVIGGASSNECEYALSILGVNSDTMKFDTFIAKEYASDPKATAHLLAAEVSKVADNSAKLLLVFPDGLLGNCSELLENLKFSLPDSLLVAGGTSGDAMTFEKTFQYCGAEVVSGAVTALLISGENVVPEISVSHGCVPIGLKREVTQADGGWVYEIDGQDAWSVFKDYLDGDPQDLNAEGIVHLCIGVPVAPDSMEDYDEYIIKTPLKLEEETGALFFPGGGLAQGQKIRLTRRDPEKIRRSAEECAQKILQRHPEKPPAFVFQFDCAGRGRILFGSCAADAIIKPLQDKLGRETPWVGFHTFGEIAPIQDTVFYHNYTVALCAIYED